MQGTSISRPVFIHHTKTSNVSSEPAQTTSPLLSTLKHENCTARGEVKVRKFLYLQRGERKFDNKINSHKN